VHNPAIVTTRQDERLPQADGIALVPGDEQMYPPYVSRSDNLDDKKNNQLNFTLQSISEDELSMIVNAWPNLAPSI
jgi:hypothetical protein